MSKGKCMLEGGTKRPFVNSEFFKAHNCYSDLKNLWKDNAIDTDSPLCVYIRNSVIVFFIGFFLSQLFMLCFSDLFVRFPSNQLKLTSSSQNLSPLSFLIDYASDQNGASILYEYSSEEYLGFFSKFSTNKRESVISDNNDPGNCWPINGTSGYVGIELGQEIYPKHFTIIHINSLNYDAAPKVIRVYNLEALNETVLISEYFFDLRIKEERRKHWGIFECQYHCSLPMKNILLEVVENYGAKVTCTYQLKVHGIPTEI